MAAMKARSLSQVEGPVIVACGAPYGSGGLGRHLQELVEYFRGRGLETRYFAASLEGGPDNGTALWPTWTRWANRWTPLRFSAAQQSFLECVAFDRALARRLPKGKML